MCARGSATGYDTHQARAHRGGKACDDEGADHRQVGQNAESAAKSGEHAATPTHAAERGK